MSLLPAKPAARFNQAAWLVPALIIGFVIVLPTATLFEAPHFLARTHVNP